MIIVDTGVLLAAADTRDRHHTESARLLDDHEPGDLVVPGTVVAETSWMIEDRLGAATEAAFVSSVANHELAAEPLNTGDYQRCAELIATYADLGLGLVDASVIAIAERLDVATIATFNHRDFRVVRPAHVDTFTLTP